MLTREREAWARERAALKKNLGAVQQKYDALLADVEEIKRAGPSSAQTVNLQKRIRGQRQQIKELQRRNDKLKIEESKWYNQQAVIRENEELRARITGCPRCDDPPAPPNAIEVFNRL